MSYFDRFFQSLRDIHASNKDLAQAIRANTETYKQEHDPSITDTSPPFKLPEAITSYYESEQKDRPGNSIWKRLERIAAVVIFLLSLIAVIFTYRTLEQVTRQANFSQDQIGTMRRQLKMDQRAWIVIKYPTIQLIDGKPLTVPIAMENIAKTTAVRLKVK